MKLSYGICLSLLVACSSASSAPVSGTYIDENNPSLTLMLTEKPDGSVAGRFEGESESLSLSARRDGDRLAGTIGSGEEALGFLATVSGDRIVFELTEEEGAGEQQVFRRVGPADDAEAAQAGAVASAGAGAGAAAQSRPASAAPSGRNVIVNDQRLSDEELGRIEQTYGVRIVDAEYWYDRISGAWGIKGGPTRGFIYSGLELGGALKADASGGGTNVFINGRELHPLDVSGLQRCMQVQPGRYWVMADGTAGYEGGPPLFNVVSLCSPPAGGGRSGGWVCDGGSCGTSRTVTGPYAVTTEGGGAGGVYTDQGLILTPN
jgi:hypothetical protein